MKHTSATFGWGTIKEGWINRKLKWEGHCIIVQLLKRLDKCGKALSAIRHNLNRHD
ncbi:MAG: hypothetical protein II666_13835 [Butyrivibrio sp.]|nr:hypothetical protein [Butyrivibrio sp.]